MAFDQATRGRLQRFVNEARWAMEEEFTRQLQNDFGLDPISGAVTPLEQLAAPERRATGNGPHPAGDAGALPSQ